MKNGHRQPFAIFLSTGDIYDVTFNDWRTKKRAKDLEEMVDLPLTFQKTHIALRPFDHLDYAAVGELAQFNQRLLVPVPDF